jgi:hypothetical protein
MRARSSWTLLIAIAVAGCSSGSGHSTGGSASTASTASSTATTATPLSGSTGQTPSAQLGVSGGLMTAKYGLQPLLFPWLSPITVTGDGFQPGVQVVVSLFGPTNTLGVSPGSLQLGFATADAAGHYSATFTIPYDGGVVGPSARITRPGCYTVQASSLQGGTVAAKDNICIDPESDAKIIDWGHERGSRPGNFPGQFADSSPERTDPEWVSVWNEKPVGAYGTVDGSHASLSDFPGTHYSHDINFELIPDTDYRWIIGSHNFDDDGAVVEVEWETQNAGSPYNNGIGNIGLPLWAMPTDGDRVYVVGRWILDVGHPDGGSGTELHPARLVAAMRQRPALTASGNPASQVDVYLSGHGGGANMFPDGLAAALDQGGHGGGRIQDLGPTAAATYYQPGPATPAERIALAPLGAVAGLSPTDLATFLANIATLSGTAGPSGLGWANNPNEERAVDDIDYDFDVPLPPQLAGAMAPVVEVTRHPEDTSLVNEVITWPDFPRSAHVHLPCKGKGSLIYARTIRFASGAPKPAHYHVRIVEIDAVDLPGLWHITTDVNGQWKDLLQATPALSQVATGQAVSIGQDFDVYTNPTDSIWVHTNGYRPAAVDTLFGHLFGLDCYGQIISIAAGAAITNTRDSDNLGDALLELKPGSLPTAPTTYPVPAQVWGNPGHFSVVILVEPK